MQSTQAGRAVCENIQPRGAGSAVGMGCPSGRRKENAGFVQDTLNVLLPVVLVWEAAVWASWDLGEACS